MSSQESLESTHEKWTPEYIASEIWWNPDSPMQAAHETITGWVERQGDLDEIYAADAEDAKNLLSLIASSVVRGDTELADVVLQLSNHNRLVADDPSVSLTTEQLSRMQLQGLMKVLWLGRNFQRRS